MTKYAVKVIPNAKQRKVLQEGSTYRVYVKSAPEDGKANQEVIEVLADFFHVKKTRVEILKGHTSRKKVVEVS